MKPISRREARLSQGLTPDPQLRPYPLPPKLGPLATFKRLLLNLYGNGKRP